MRRIFMLLLPLAAAGGGYWLRSRQLLLPADGMPAFFKNIWGVYLWSMLALLALLLLLLCLGERRKADFKVSCSAAVGLPFQWAGVLLFCASAALSAITLWPAWQTAEFCIGAGTVLAAFLMLPAVMVRFKRSDSGVGLCLLPPLALAIYRLTRYYFSFANGPDLFSREMRLLFFAALLLFLLALTALAFGSLCHRRLLFFAGLTVGSAGAALQDTAAFVDALLLLGCAGLALGFYLSVLFSGKEPDCGAVNFEVVADPFAGKAPCAAEDSDPFPVIDLQKAPPPVPAAAPEKKAEDRLDLGRVDRLWNEMQHSEK